MLSRIYTATVATFAPNGPLRRAGLDERPGQAQLACMIAEAIERRTWGIGQAPCGSGKGMAYLVPGLLAVTGPEADRKTPAGTKRAKLIVSTGNIALQDQLYRKDIPMVAKALGLDVRAVVLKGRGNYLCHLRLLEADMAVNRSRLAAGDVIPGLRQILAWSQDPGCSGDRDDIPAGLTMDAFRRCAASTDECLGDGCPHYAPEDPAIPKCFVERAREGADAAHVVLVNHYYLTLSRLPASVLLAVDEAHSFEDAARNASSLSLRVGGVRRLASSLKAVGIEQVDTLRLSEGVERLLAIVRQRMDGKMSMALHPGWLSEENPVSDVLLDAVLTELDIVRADQPDRKGIARIEGLIERTKAIKERSAIIYAGEAKNGEIVWATADANQRDFAEAKITPADARGVTGRLQKGHPAAVMVSGTMAPGGDFGPTLVGLGFRQPSEEVAAGIPESPTEDMRLVLPSPFDLAHNGLLVLPDGPGVRDPAWPAWAVDRAVDAVEQAQGNTLVLCTSWSAASRIAQGIRSRTDYPVDLQGDAGRRELAANLRKGGRVLVATRSFFEGLDIAGEALSCVVLDRIPFTPPDDPVEDAVARVAASRLGGSAFIVRALPRAMQLLAQAAGRLIRVASDRGAMVILDTRARGRDSIGAAVRRTVAPFLVSSDVADVGRHLRGEPLRGLGITSSAGHASQAEQSWQSTSTASLGWGARALR